MPSSSDYLRLLERWLPSTRRHLRPHPQNPGLLSYGPGVHGHWSMQTHTTAFAAFAVLAASPLTDVARTGMSRDELWDTALRMLRFTLNGHLSGPGHCVDGERWGHSWISNLCLERMMHAVEELDPYLTDEDQDGLRRMLLSECDWLTDQYEVVAGPIPPANRPESNMWNGSMLWRTALMYPEAPRAAEYRERGTAFLLNAMSFPQDATSDQPFAGRPLRDWHVGANFLDTGACYHHNYMNVGYVNVTLSNLAMLHFSGRHHRWHLPEALYLHLADVWPLAKSWMFPDGRLLRIGGDTRVRYCYCQDYALAGWLMARDRLGDTDTAAFEDGWLRQVAREQETNPDGSFLGARLRRLEEQSPLYYCRLEGDKAASLSMAACWRRRLADFHGRPEAPRNPAPIRLWSDDFHGSMMALGPRRKASWTWLAAEKPMGLCVPTAHSDMAEWRYNLAGRIFGTGQRMEPIVHPVTKQTFDGGFLTSGWTDMKNRAPIAEGESEDIISRTYLACAALPDDATVLVLQRCRSLNRFYFRMAKGLFLNVPNDTFNGGFRRLECDARLPETLRSRPGRRETLDCGQWLTLDGDLSVQSLNGAPLLLNRPDHPTANIHHHLEQVGGWLYLDEICQGNCHDGLPLCRDAGEVLFEAAAAVRAGCDAQETARLAAERPAAAIAVLDGGDADALLSCVARALDGSLHALVLNASDAPLRVAVAGGEPLGLAPGEARLTRLDDSH